MATENQISVLSDFEDLKEDLELQEQSSIASDLVSAAGIQGIDVNVDAAATISTTSTAKSTADSSNVSSDSASVASVAFNSGLQADPDGLDNSITVMSDAGLSGVAGTTVKASASTSEGSALSYAEIQDSAGISDVGDLTVGGELNALGTAVNTITSSSETVVGISEAGSQLSGVQLGFGSAQIDVSSDAAIQGLAQLTNSATAAATSEGHSTAEAFANQLTGASLDGLKVGGVGSVAGEVSFGNTSNATNVVGDAKATNELEVATGLSSSASGEALQALGITEGINVSSDATITGLSSITSSATAATTDGDAAALSDGGAIQGIELVDAEIGGIASITGQSTFTGSAKSTNVTGGTEFKSEADSNLDSVSGFSAADLVNVNSDATLKGLSSINLSAMAESTGAVGGETLADAAFNGGALTGAELDDVAIGGVGTVLGQVGFTGAASASNVTGDAKTYGIIDSATGLTTGENETINMQIDSDGTLKGIASVTASATAATTAGLADADAIASTIDGADFQGLVNIGGVGSIQGAASFNLSAKSTNVTAGDDELYSEATAAAGATGLSAIVGEGADFGINIASDATLSGTAIGSLKAEAFSTGTSATATLGAGSNLIGATLGDLHVGGVANLTGAAQLTGNGTASSVDGISETNSGLGATVTGLDAIELDVASDATVTAQAFGTLNATASSTAANAVANAGDDLTQLTGLDAADGMNMEIGGIATVSALAQGNEMATASSVGGEALASASLDALGAGVRADDEGDLTFHSSSDADITGIAKLDASVDASNIGSDGINAEAIGDFSAIGLSGLSIGTVDSVDGVLQGGDPGIDGITTLKGQAQITGTLNAESVSGDAFAGDDESASTITGFDRLILNGASDGTILGTASGVFNTTATSTQGDAVGFYGQELTGISSLLLNLGGNGTINAIVQDTNFVTAHSVSGNATATASVDAIGLDAGNIHIAGNATIMANVGVDSSAESSTVGG